MLGCLVPAKAIMDVPFKEVNFGEEHQLADEDLFIGGDTKAFIRTAEFPVPTKKKFFQTVRAFYEAVLHKMFACFPIDSQLLKDLRILDPGSRMERSPDTGCPGSLYDAESVDGAPTVNLGHQKEKPVTEASGIREERMKSWDDQHGLVDWSTLLDLHESAEDPEDTTEMSHDRQGEGITDLTMDDTERMEDVLKQTTAELGHLRNKALDTQLSQEAFQKNEDKTKFYTGIHNFLVLMQIWPTLGPNRHKGIRSWPSSGPDEKKTDPCRYWPVVPKDTGPSPLR
ncbi:unnamed protein product [Leuciscus chuanchicus]